MNVIKHDGKTKPQGKFFWIRLRNGNDAAGIVGDIYQWIWDEDSQDPDDTIEYSL